jgi:hypothetical protein
MTEAQFDKAMRSYETIVVVSALLVGFALSLLPSVLLPPATSTGDQAPSLMLGICRISLIAVVCLNFFGICVLSLATFYLNQMFEKHERYVMIYRLATQSFRKWGQLAGCLRG